MFQLRDADPWANTQDDDTAAASAVKEVGSDIASAFKTLFSAGSAITPETPVLVHEQNNATSPGVKTTTTTPLLKPTPWYKTPIGIIAILAGAFAGYKYVLPKLRGKK